MAGVRHSLFVAAALSMCRKIRPTAAETTLKQAGRPRRAALSDGPDTSQCGRRRPRAPGLRAIALAAALYRKMKRIAMQYISEVQDKAVEIVKLEIRTTIGYGCRSAAIDPNSWIS
jgi:hypothetical protein